MDTQEIIIDACSTVITNVAEQEAISAKELGIRFDLEHEKAKPVLGLFHRAKFLKRTTIKELAKASGAGVLSGILSPSIRKIIHSVFEYGMRQYEASTTKELFVLLHLTKPHAGSSLIPAIALYKQGIAIETILVSEIVSGA